jgi:hypothetical protein
MEGHATTARNPPQQRTHPAVTTIVWSPLEHRRCFSMASADSFVTPKRLRCAITEQHPQMQWMALSVSKLHVQRFIEKRDGSNCQLSLVK